MRVTLTGNPTNKFMQTKKVEKILNSLTKHNKSIGTAMSSFIKNLEEISEKEKRDVFVMVRGRRTLPFKNYKFKFWLFENKVLTKCTKVKIPFFAKYLESFDYLKSISPKLIGFVNHLTQKKNNLSLTLK